MAIKTKVIHVEMTVKHIGNNFAHFNCGENVKGTIHVPEKGKVTVILEGEYILGEFHCVVCAVDAITDLSSKVIVSEEICGMTYSAYKTSIANFANA